MHPMPPIVLAPLALALALAAHAATATAAPSDDVPDPVIPAGVRALFDRPSGVERRPFSLKSGRSGPRGVVRCFHYPDLTVKELDEGDQGATAISVTPMQPGARRPPCGKQDDPGEVVLRGGRGGNFVGAKGGFAYVGSTYGNGTIPFTIYDAKTGTAIFDDATSTEPGYPISFSVEGGVLTLAYTRAVQAPCSIPGGGQACWTRFAREARLPEAVAKLPPPVDRCKIGYAAWFAADRTEPDPTLPSIVAYDVTLTLERTGQTKVLSRGALSCAPQP